MGKEGETGVWTYQTMVKGDDLILVVNQRPVEFATEEGSAYAHHHCCEATG
ncbi:MAG: hypothetical protein IPO56_15280 [Flavobacteriales bacterium]|jgi:hypothetical protein|nr:hypothetical protein [Flavobacteriales bacterium]MBK7103088.1 hypothetical protein [Flavobacteriales bacterium]MBK7110861.1 hypothetical protein [Flavobacteriales bacterium]MBK7482276.1 hypothetical protein [Flavobacteriales bacterium]MBK8708687.1 hypothetical protein [Flavobacteriales bacterium]